jgi:hypothetical protein
MLRKTWLAFSASAMLGAAAIVSNAALAQPFPAPSPALVLLVAPVLAALLVLGPPTFLVLPASEAVVLASAAVRVPFTTPPGAMRTATPPTIAMAAQAMPTAADRRDTATGRLMASMSNSKSNSSGCSYTYKYSYRLRAYTRLGLLRIASAVLRADAPCTPGA